MSQKIAASVVYALLLAACAFFAGFAVFGFAFAIGDGGGSVGPGMAFFLIATLVGAVALGIGALSCWARNRVIRGIALAGVLLVLPAGFLFTRENGWAMWSYAQTGYHYGASAWSSVLLPVPLDLVALVWSGLRLRRMGHAAGQGHVTVNND